MMNSPSILSSVSAPQLIEAHNIKHLAKSLTLPYFRDKHVFASFSGLADCVDSKMDTVVR